MVSVTHLFSEGCQWVSYCFLYYWNLCFYKLISKGEMSLEVTYVLSLVYESNSQGPEKLYGLTKVAWSDCAAKTNKKKTWNYKSQWSATSLSRKCWPVRKLECTNIWCLFKVMYVHCKEQYLELKEEQREHHRSPPDLSLPWSSLLNHSTGDEMASLGGTLGAGHASQQQAPCFSLGCQMKSKKAFGFCGY